jgi:hypothetical protein
MRPEKSITYIESVGGRCSNPPLSARCSIFLHTESPSTLDAEGFPFSTGKGTIAGSNTTLKKQAHQGQTFVQSQRKQRRWPKWQANMICGSSRERQCAQLIMQEPGFDLPFSLYLDHTSAFELETALQALVHVSRYLVSPGTPVDSMRLARFTVSPRDHRPLSARICTSQSFF